MTAAGDGELARVRAELSALGWRPSRRLGQNLMTDANLARAIVRDAGVGPGDVVLEVGPGAGALTEPLCDAGVRLVAVDVDARLLELVRRRLAGRADVRFLRADALDGKHRLAAAVRAEVPDDGSWHLVANLPYSISAPLLAVLARLPSPPASMTVLVQREVADRITAEPGTRAWGPLTVRLRPVYDAESGRVVPASVFWPRPRVESRVVRLVRREDRPGADGLARLDRAVEALFGRRRQTLGRVLGDLWGRDRAAGALAELGLDPRRRAETLAPGELQGLAERPEWAGKAPSGDAPGPG